MINFRETYWRHRRRCGMATLLILALSGITMRANKLDRTNESSRWMTLPSLPDPIGFGGMIAGVLDGMLVVGGGSQWDKPVWAQGARLLSDRIFTLSSLEGEWQLSESRLPMKAGHFASAATNDAIYFAGGLGGDGTLRAAYKLQLRGAQLVSTRLPDLPEPVVYAAAAIREDRLYVIGGLADLAAKQASRAVWSLDLASSESTTWIRETDLPQSGLFVATAAATAEALFVIGGMGFDSADKLTPSRLAYRLTGGRWERLPDLPAARVGAASPCVVTDDHQILVVGGYAEIFGGAQREHPGFPPETFVYDIPQAQWTAGPTLPTTPAADRDLAGDPGPAPMIGAPVVRWNDLAIVVSGEVRISTRTPSVLALRLPLSP